MTTIQRKKARALAEQKDKLKKDVRNGTLTKSKAKSKARAR